MQDPFVDSSGLKIFDANEKIYLDQMRQALILDVQKRGAVHGR
jgi:hypothetical protein